MPSGRRPVARKEMYQSLRRVIRSIEESTSDDVAALAVNILGEITDAAPVDTGFLKNNFVASVGVPFRGTVGSEEQARSIRRSRGAGAGGGELYAPRDYASELLSYSLAQGDIYISNNATYAPFVVFNHPSGLWMEDAIQRAIVYSSA